MAEKLKVGDVVMLTCGSPKMTVYDIDQESISVIFWNVGKFEFTTLSKISSDSVVKES